MLKKLKLELKELNYPKKKQVVRDLCLALGTTVVLTGLIYLINTGVQEVIKLVV